MSKYVCPECGGELRLWRVFTVRELHDVCPDTGHTGLLSEPCRENGDNALECPTCGYFEPECERTFVVNVDGDVEWRKPEPAADLPF